MRCFLRLSFLVGYSLDWASWFFIYTTSSSIISYSLILLKWSVLWDELIADFTIGLSRIEFISETLRLLNFADWFVVDSTGVQSRPVLENLSLYYIDCPSKDRLFANSSRFLPTWTINFPLAELLGKSYLLKSTLPGIWGYTRLNPINSFRPTTYD